MAGGKKKPFAPTPSSLRPKMTTRTGKERAIPKPFTPALQDKFIELFTENANIRVSCEAIGINRHVIANTREADEEFNKRFLRAVEMGSDALEDEAIRRAKDGYLRPVFQGGIKVGDVREYSDTLMMFMLKGRRPEKFKDRASNEVTGPNGGPITSINTVMVPTDLTGMTDDDLAKLYREKVAPSK